MVMQYFLYLCYPSTQPWSISVRNIIKGQNASKPTTNKSISYSSVLITLPAFGSSSRIPCGWRACGQCTCSTRFFRFELCLIIRQTCAISVRLKFACQGSSWHLQVLHCSQFQFGAVLYPLQITVSVWPVRIEGDKKLFRPLRSNQLQESRVKQTVAGAQAQMHSSTFSTTIT